jgi:hypothetical protein
MGSFGHARISLMPAEHIFDIETHCVVSEKKGDF